MTYLFFSVRRFVPNISEEIHTDVNFHRIICLILPLSTPVIIYNNMEYDSLAEAVHYQLGKYLLKDRLTLLGVEIRNADSVFQLPERCFYFPSEVIQIFQYRRRKFIFRQRSCYRFPACLETWIKKNMTGLSV